MHLGTYNTPDEAFIAYKKYKEETIKKRVKELINVLPSSVVLALYNYTVEIDD